MALGTGSVFIIKPDTKTFRYFPARQGRLTLPDNTEIKGRANSPSEPQFIPIRF